MDRLIVSLDVNPYQKKIFLSDQQKIRQDTTDQKETKVSNGYLSRIQGIKTPEKKYKPVLFPYYTSTHIFFFYSNITVKFNMRHD